MALMTSWGSESFNNYRRAPALIPLVANSPPPEVMSTMIAVSGSFSWIVAMASSPSILDIFKSIKTTAGLVT